MKLRCLIIDDEPIARKLLQEYIEETDFLELAATAVNPVKATGLITSENIDLIFLDINMPKMSGIEFLRTSNRLPLTILTTAYTEYALEGFELDVVDYLVKPFSFERFLKACNKAKEYFEQAKLESQGKQILEILSNKYIGINMGALPKGIEVQDQVDVELEQPSATP